MTTKNLSDLPDHSDQAGDIYKRTTRARLAVKDTLRDAKRAEQDVLLERLIQEITLRFACPKSPILAQIRDTVSVLDGHFEDGMIVWMTAEEAMRLATRSAATMKP